MHILCNHLCSAVVEAECAQKDGLQEDPGWNCILSAAGELTKNRIVFFQRKRNSKSAGKPCV